MNFNDIVPFIKQETPEAAFKALQTSRTANKKPLVLKALFLLGAIMSAVAFLGFLSLLFISIGMDIFLMFGALFIGLAFAGQFVKTGGSADIFKEQFLLVCMLIGKMCLIGWALSFFKYGFSAMLFYILLAITVITYPFFKNSADRFLSCFATAVFAYIVSGDTFAFRMFWIWNFIKPELAVAISFAVSCFVFYYGKKSLYPMAYALIIASGAVAYSNVAGPYIDVIFNLPKLIIAFTIAGLAYHHVDITSRLMGKTVIALGCAFALMFIFNMASLMGIGLILLGYNFRDRKLSVLGYTVFAGGLSFLYYNLETTLLFKSYILCGSGLIMLAVAVLAGRAVMKRGTPCEK